MTLRDPIVIATIRGLLTALGQAAFTGLTTYQVTGNTGDSFVVAALAFLVALGIRGGVEGAWDQRKGPRDEEVPEPPLVRGANKPAVVVRRQSGPGPIPPIDFDQPYHYSSVDDKTRHPGVNWPDGCPWCIAEGNDVP